MEQFTQNKKDGARTYHFICEYSCFPVGPRNITSYNPHYVGRFTALEFTTVFVLCFVTGNFQFPTLIGSMDACYQAFDKDG